MTLPIGRVGLAGAGLFDEHSHVKRATCNLANGDLYTFPNASSVVDATQPVTFTWNTACAMNTLVDLYLYEPSSANGLIHAFTGVTFADGKFTRQLQPAWWNSTTTAKLQLSIINSGTNSWENGPVGPLFQINYPASAIKSTLSVSTSGAAKTSGSVFENVEKTKHAGGISKGGIAAAVLVPLLALIAGVVVLVIFWRRREAEKRRRWSQAMSSHSNLEWEKGARPGEKPQSILGRPSLSSVHRPASLATSSILATENNMAGYGTSGVTFPRPDIGLRSVSHDQLPGTTRQSRISFAETTRPDRRSRLSLGGDIRPTVSAGGVFKSSNASRSASDLHTPRGKHSAYASGSAIIDDEEEDINISPSQMQGPNAFADAEMRRVGQGRRTGRRSIMSFGEKSRRNSTASALSADDFKSAASARGSVDELRDIEAVMLMRRSMMSQGSKGSPVIPPVDSHPGTPDMPDSNYIEDLSNPQTVTSPAPVPSTVAYGPDQMLAVYAARGKVSPSGQSAPTFPVPMPVATKPAAVRQNSGNPMRLLTSLAKRDREREREQATPVEITSPQTQDMKSFVHLNTGTVSSSVVDALPPPGPGQTLRIPSRQRSNTVTRHSGGSAGSRYSADEEEIGNAR